MDNRLMLLAFLAGLMLLLGCTAQADNAKTTPNDSAPTGAAGTVPAFPADITEDAGFNDTYNELDAVQ